MLPGSRNQELLPLRQLSPAQPNCVAWDGGKQFDESNDSRDPVEVESPHSIIGVGIADSGVGIYDFAT